MAALSDQDSVIICPVVRGEILYGIVRLPEGKRRTELMSKADKLFATLPCEVVSEAAGDHYSKVKFGSFSKGLALDENDLWIAATALPRRSRLQVRAASGQSSDSRTLSPQPP